MGVKKWNVREIHAFRESFIHFDDNSVLLIAIEERDGGKACEMVASKEDSQAAIFAKSVLDFLTETGEKGKVDFEKLNALQEEFSCLSDVFKALFSSWYDENDDVEFDMYILDADDFF